MEDKDFDKFWQENRTRLISIYNDEIDLSMAIMNIAKFVWKEARRNAK